MSDRRGRFPSTICERSAVPTICAGFRRFRFRDRNLLLLQAEYRWEIFTAVDGAIFYDAGKVAPAARGPRLRRSRVGLRHRLPVRHDQRRLPPRRRRVRQQRRQALHLQVRPCLLARGACARPGSAPSSCWPRSRAAAPRRAFTPTIRSRSTTTRRSTRARPRRSKAATGTTSPSTRSSSRATAATCRQ